MQTTFDQWSQGQIRIKWGAIFAGLAVGIATQMALALLGLAIGAWSIDLRDAQPAEGIPLGTGLWAGLSMLLSAFIGGYVASSLSGTSIRRDGLYHGAVLWGVTWIVFAWLTTTALSVMIGGVFTAFGSGLQMLNRSVGTAVSAAAANVSGRGTLNIQAADLRKQVESVLRATEKPELQPGTINKDMDRATAEVKDGQSLERVTDAAIGEIQEKLTAMDRTAAVNVMMNKLGLSEKQAQEVAQSTLGMVASLKEAGSEVKEKSLDLGNATMAGLGSAAWWLFVFAVLSLGTSLVGGFFGISHELLGQMEGDAYRKEVKRAVNL
ncbi:MAG TPA: hypothetical protein VFQ34_04875 [Nitrospiraceae bacterium]|nr:hypothetical protein [Nitrospiraceae bacterium]